MSRSRLNDTQVLPVPRCPSCGAVSWDRGVPACGCRRPSLERPRSDESGVTRRLPKTRVA